MAVKLSLWVFFALCTLNATVLTWIVIRRTYPRVKAKGETGNDTLAITFNIALAAVILYVLLTH
jgi:hypothetical protein